MGRVILHNATLFTANSLTSVAIRRASPHRRAYGLRHLDDDVGLLSEYQDHIVKVVCGEMCHYKHRFEIYKTTRDSQGSIIGAPRGSARFGAILSQF